jgi:hypothetical protein
MTSDEEGWEFITKRMHIHELAKVEFPARHNLNFESVLETLPLIGIRLRLSPTRWKYTFDDFQTSLSVVNALATLSIKMTE